MGATTEAINLELDLPQNTGAFRFRHTLNTQDAQISGFVMSHITPGTINFKVITPSNLDATPNARIKIFFMSLTENSGNPCVEFVLQTNLTPEGQLVDQAYSAENVEIVDVPYPSESLMSSIIPLTSAPGAGQFLMGQITRNATSTYDTAENIMIIKIQLLVNVDTS